MGRLDGKVAVVTGGANGMGRATCVRFAEEGAKVVVADLLEEPGAEAVSAVSAVGGDAVFVRFDASSASDTEAVMQTAVDHFGALDVAIVAAGSPAASYRSGDFETQRRMTREFGEVPPDIQLIDLPIEEWERVLSINLTGTLFAIQSAARRMRGRGGSIVTFSAIGAKAPVAPIAYSAAKAGVWMLTKNAAVALAPLGIRVNAIGPGTIATNMTLVMEEERPDVLASLMAKTPMGRMGTTLEIAKHGPVPRMRRVILFHRRDTAPRRRILH